MVPIEVDWLVFALCLTTALLWLATVVREHSIISRIQRLPYGPPAAGLPAVTVVIPARNEAPRIRATVEDALAQEGVVVDVVVVDDFSEDDTAAVVQSMVDAGARVTLLATKKQPKGWMAKNYALEVGQARAAGQFVLFTNANVALGKRTVANAVDVMQTERLDHLTLHPRFDTGSALEAAVVPLLTLLTHSRLVPAAAATPDSGVGAGIAAFNMVRADAYRLRGTHARIRGALLDDRALGWMMRDDGGRGSVMRAVGHVRVRPMPTRAMLRVGIGKAMLTAFGTSGLLTAAAGFGLLLTAVLPAIGMAVGAVLLADGRVSLALPAAVLAGLLPIAGLWKARTLVRFPVWGVLLFPVGLVLMGVESMRVGLRLAAGGRFEWRGRHYAASEISAELSGH